MVLYVIYRSQVRQNNDSQNKEESPIARIYQVSDNVS